MKLRLLAFLLAGLAAITTSCIGPIAQEPPGPAGGCFGGPHPGPRNTGSPLGVAIP